MATMADCIKLIELHDKKRTEEQKKELIAFIKTVPKLHRLAFTKAMVGLNQGGPEARVYCKSCMGFEEVRIRVRECTQWATCPHWYHRPYQDKTNTEDDT